MDKKVISNAVAAMMLAADYLKVLEENDGLLKAKNALIAEKRSLVEKNKQLRMELEAMSRNLLVDKRERKRILDVPPGLDKADSRVVIDKLGLPRQVDLNG